MIDTIFEGIYEATLGKVNEFVVGFCTDMLQWVGNVTVLFWNDKLIISFIELSTQIAGAIFLASIIAMIWDAGEDMAADKRVYFSVAFMNIIKGIGFVICAPLVGQYGFMLMQQVVQTLDLSSAVATIDLTSEVYMITSGAMGPILAPLIVAIACVVFMIQVLQKCGLMLVQIGSSFLYLPGIVRGDTTSMGSWIRQSIAICLTYFFQYTFFYIGVVSFVRGSIFVAFGLWLAMGGIARILDKFGLSTGTGGALSGVGSMAIQGIGMLAK